MTLSEILLFSIAVLCLIGWWRDSFRLEQARAECRSLQRRSSEAAAARDHLMALAMKDATRLSSRWRCR